MYSTSHIQLQNHREKNKNKNFNIKTYYLIFIYSKKKKIKKKKFKILLDLIMSCQIGGPRWVTTNLSSRATTKDISSRAGHNKSIIWSEL